MHKTTTKNQHKCIIKNFQKTNIKKMKHKNKNQNEINKLVNNKLFQ